MACDDTKHPTSVTQAPELSASQHGNSGVVTETAALDALGPPPSQESSVSLARNLRNGNLNWQLKASGLTPGNAYTVWIGNFPKFDDDGGWGSGGLVGGSGQVTAAGNHCVWDLVSFSEGGFRPGTKPNCERIRVNEQVWFFLLDHGEWEPGDILERWDPNGVIDSSDETPTTLQGAWGAFFPPLS